MNRDAGLAPGLRKVCSLLIYALLAYTSNAASQSDAKDVYAAFMSDIRCDLTYTHDYDIGDKFRFPVNALRSEFEAAEYRFVDRPIDRHNLQNRVLYSDIEGKDFTIQDIKDYAGDSTRIILTDGTWKIAYILRPSRAKLRSNFTKHAVQSEILPYAVYISESDNFKNYKGRQYLTTYPWKGKQKYETVTITDVIVGIEDKPVGVVLVDSISKNSKADTLYVSVCGNNLRTNDQKANHISHFLVKKDPSITNPTWDLIKNGKLAKGMTENEVTLSQGKIVKKTVSLDEKNELTATLYFSNATVKNERWEACLI